MDIIFSEKKSLLLNTNLSENNFSKSTFGLNFTEKGTLAKFSLFENNFTFEDFSFDGTTVSDFSQTVCFEKEVFFCDTGLSIINSNDKNKKARFTFALLKTLSKAINDKVILPKIGLGGILYKEKTSKKNSELYLIEIYFLPESLFEFSISHYDEKTYSNNQGFWQNKALTGNNALIFLQGVIAYYYFSEIFPFMKTSLQERQEDIIDSNFIQIENLVNGINSNLAANINFTLRLDNQYERDKSFLDLDILKSQIGINDDGTFFEPVRNTTISNEQFQINIEKKQKSKEFATAQKRFFKRNSIIIIISLILIIFISNFIYKTHLDNLQKPSAKNLTSTQAVATFFSGYHQLKPQLMSIVSKGSNPQKIIDMISNVYVTSQTRTAFEGKNTSITLELFLTRPELMNSWIFGITNFTIDDKPAHNRFSPITKKEFLELKKLNKIIQFNQNQIKTHKVKYNFIHSNGYPNDIIIETCVANVECTYIKDQWYITNIQIEQSQTSVLQDEFRKEYFSLEEENKSPEEIAHILKSKYEWIPDQRAMLDAKKEAEYQKNYFK